MSFSTEVKNEILDYEERNFHCLNAELTAYILFCGELFGSDNGFNIVIRDSVKAVLNRAKALIYKLYEVEVSIKGNEIVIDDSDLVQKIIENTNNAIILSLDNNFVKSFTVNKLAVLFNIPISSFSCVSSSVVSCNDCFIFSPSSGFTNFIKYVLANPIKTAIIDVIINTKNVAPTIFPSLFGDFIFDIDVVIVKNINGVITTSNKFKNMSPKGLKTVAFSLNINPTIAPIIIDTNNIIVDL